jgi:hypothetical protein
VLLPTKRRLRADLTANTARAMTKHAKKGWAAMTRFLMNNEDGAVTVDWVALTAGLLLLGIVASYAVMANSAGYLSDDFAEFNDQYQDSAISVADLGKTIDFGQ